MIRRSLPLLVAILLFALHTSPSTQAALAPISGTITDTASTPLADVTIRIYDANGVFWASALTDSTGAYSITPGVPSGDYFASTLNDAGYINEFNNSAQCALSACDMPHAAPGAVPIAISAPAPATIDFTLELGGRASGTITDEATGLGIAGVRVRILDGTGMVILSDGVSDALGNYITSAGIPNGTYFAQTTNAGSHVNELFGGFVCVNICSLTNGTSFPVNSGLTTAGIDFVLKIGGKIAGQLMGNGMPISAFAAVDDASGNTLTTAFVDTSGIYVTPDALPAGDYYVHTYNSAGFVNEVYNNLPCSPFCDTSAGAPVAVVAGSVTTGIDFDLAVGGTLVVTVADASGTPLPNIHVSVETLSGYGSGMFTDAAGIMQFQGIAPGSYRVRTVDNPSWGDELYNNVPCENRWCDPNLGTLVNIIAGAATPISFSLDPAVPPGTLEGMVTANGVGISAFIGIYNSSGQFVTGVSTDMFGHYAQTGLPPGQYFAATSGTGFADEVYNNIPCPGFCDVTVGTPIVITSGNTAFAHFALDAAPPPLQADLQLALVAAPTSAPLHSLVTYTGTVTNLGPSAATNVTILLDGVPNHLLGTIPSGGTATFMFTELAQIPGTFVVSRSVTADQVDVNPADNSATATVIVDPPPVFGHFGSAAIDGVMGAGEWANAACHDLYLNLPGGGITPATLCAMNDTSNMYFAMKFERGFLDPGNSFTIEIDNDHDGIMENGDDVFLYNPNNFYDDFRTDANGCPVAGMCGFFDIDHGGTNDGAGAIANDGQYTIYEMSHPLNSGDTGRDIAASIGDTVGFFAAVRMIAPGGVYPTDYGDTAYPGWGVYATLNFVGESASQTVVTSSIVTTDTEGDGATAGDPIETTVEAGGAGSVTIEEGPVPGTGPGEGYSLLNQQVVISAPPAAPGSYFTIQFRIDASLIVPPLTAMNIQLQKTDGAGIVTIIPNCGATIMPPCVSRSVASDGDALLTVYTQTASIWRFLEGVTPPTPTIADLVQQVGSLSLPRGAERALVATLNAASSAFQRGQVRTARLLLRAFELEVTALKRSRRLPVSVADTLIETARAVAESI